MNLDIKHFRTQVSRQPLSGYGEFDSEQINLLAGFETWLDSVLDRGWERQGVRLKTLEPPIPWAGFHRSFCAELHAWKPLSFLLAGHSRTKRQDKARNYLDAAYGYAKDWIDTFQISAFDSPPSEFADLHDANEKNFAWYDMAVGQRVHRLAYLLDLLARDPAYSDQDVQLFYQTLVFHHELLSDPKIFRNHSNHGFYQVLGQLAAARRFEPQSLFCKYQKIAANRLEQLLGDHFTIEGVHKEHSPGYQHMLLGSLIGAINADVIKDQNVVKLVEKMQASLSWMFQPDRELVAFGDTVTKGHAFSPSITNHLSNPDLRKLCDATNPVLDIETGVKAYDDAGYVFARRFANNTDTSISNCSYLAQMAGFHSRVHKHADHLSFVWCDRGRNILVDPGRYQYSGRTEIGTELFDQGFWYSDPNRIYVESTHAHNTVEIDGRSYPRAKVKPFGSAIKNANEQQGFIVTECELYQHGRVRHYRALILKPRAFLIVMDWLDDRSKTKHDFRQWFHFSPAWHAEVKGQHIRVVALANEEISEESIACASLLPGSEIGDCMRGQLQPRQSGWYADGPTSIVPSLSLNFRQLNQSRASFATVFAFANRVETDANTRINASMRTGRLVWRADGKRHTISFDRSTGNLIVRNGDAEPN